MIFWVFYLLSLFCFVILMGAYFGKYRHSLSLFCFVIFMTPAQIDIGSTYYGPAVISFMLDLILEQRFSLRLLRPLVLTLPISMILFWMYVVVRRRFS